MSAVDWPGLMRAGLRGAGLKPAEFWALTPAELELMLGKPAGLAPMTRAGLDDLMRAYPDQASVKKVPSSSEAVGKNKDDA